MDCFCIASIVHPPILGCFPFSTSFKILFLSLSFKARPYSATARSISSLSIIFSNLKNAKKKALISQNQLNNEGFIVEGSFSPLQTKLLNQGNPFIIEHDNYQSFLYIKLKNINKVSAYSLLNSIWEKDQAKRISKENVPIVFQIVKFKKEKWLAIYNLNGTVGKKDFEQVLTSLNREFNENNVVQAKKFINIIISELSIETLPQIVKEEVVNYKDLFKEQLPVPVDFFKERTFEESIEESNTYSIDEFVSDDFWESLSRKDVKKLYKRTKEQLDIRKGLFEFL